MATKTKKKTFLSTNASDAGGRSMTTRTGTKTSVKAKATTTTASSKTQPKLTAEQFARNQLRKAGIKPGTGDVKAQFRKLNAAAAKRRHKAGLGTAASVGASSALAAKSMTASPKAQQGKAAVIKTKTEKNTAVASKSVAVAAKSAPKPPKKKKKATRTAVVKTRIY